MFSYDVFTPQVCDKLIQIWKQINIELTEKKNIIKKLTRLLQKYREACKNKTKNESKFREYVESTTELFYIGKCKCQLKIDRCNCGKIPDRLHEFMLDQHNKRILTIPQYLEVEVETSTVLPSLNLGASSIYQPEESDVHELENYEPPASQIHTTTMRKMYTPRYRTPRFAMMCDRFGVSDRIASVLASALFADIQFKDEQGEIIVMDKRKMSREREKSRQDILRANHDEESLIAFSFDGRKNDSLTREKINEVYHTTMRKEPHLVVVREPHSSLIGYVNLENKGETAKAKQTELIEFFKYKNLSLENLIAVCSDGEATNTGTSGGILRLIERYVNRPIHWFICLLHFNELPFRHLYNTVEKSVTTGPTKSTGSLAQMIDVSHTLQVIENFQVIPLEHIPTMSADAENQLSTDVKYLYQIAQAVSSGSCSINLANIKPGPVGHSRWITKASRLLRLYIATKDPSENLKILARYIMKVYVPMYLNVKYYHSAVYGSALLGKFIQWTQYLPDNLRNIVNPVIQNNSYFAHSENVLLSMLFDNRKEIRNFALQKILYIRDNLCDISELREYVKPIINFDCTDYVHMIDLEDKALLFEPPFTRNIPYEHLQQYLESVHDENPPFLDPLIPCHIQGTERYVQVLASVAKRSIDKTREGLLASVCEGRKKVPRMESRRDLEGNL
ncbi:uncharacterized protein [Musca autumnalis]|uniref:uncharacterized protein n=1 Tax=Musca autumnalis TaxID=221902 RepID=UPI003CFA13EC